MQRYFRFLRTTPFPMRRPAVMAGNATEVVRLRLPQRMQSGLVCKAATLQRASLLKTVRPLFLLLPETEDERALLFLVAANFVFCGWMMRQKVILMLGRAIPSRAALADPSCAIPRRRASAVGILDSR